MFVLDDEEVAAQEKERKEKKKKGKKLTTEEEQLERVRAEAAEKNKYWAPILLLFPLGPVCIALTTVVFGGVIINASPDICNAHLKTFMQGAVGLSYILILFYAYCWIGPRPITKLKTLKIFYSVYGVICVGWWGVFGSLQAATATSSGLNSCLQTAPALFVFSQYQVTIFWLMLCFFLCFAFKEMRSHWMASEHVKQEKLRAEQEVIRKKEEAEEAARVVAEGAAQIKREKEEADKQAKAERDRLYQDVVDGDEEMKDAAAAAAEADALEDQDQEDVEEEEEDDENQANVSGGEAEDEENPEGKEDA